MRAILCLVLAACAYTPEPQPPRVVCNGAAYASSNVAVMSSECQAVPADRCWNDDSEECAAEANERRERNDRIHKQRTGVLIGILALSVILVSYAATQ